MHHTNTWDDVIDAARRWEQQNPQDWSLRHRIERGKTGRAATFIAESPARQRILASLLPSSIGTQAGRIAGRYSDTRTYAAVVETLLDTLYLGDEGSTDGFLTWISHHDAVSAHQRMGDDCIGALCLGYSLLLEEGSRMPLATMVDMYEGAQNDVDFAFGIVELLNDDPKPDTPQLPKETPACCSGFLFPFYK